MQRSGEELTKLKARVLFATRNALRDAADDRKTVFDAAVSQWSNKPSFEVEVNSYPDLIEATVKPAGKHKKIFGYVDMGTRGPYPIPKFVIPGKLLKFRTGYNARTAPVARAAAGSGMATGGWVSKAQVMHPGIKAREFSQHFLDNLRPSLQDRVNTAIEKIA